MDTTAYDQRFFGSIDMFDETIATATNAHQFEDSVPPPPPPPPLSSSASNHPDMLVYSMYPSTSSAQPSLDPSPIHPFYSLHSNQVTPPQSATLSTFMDDYQLPSSSSSSDLNPLAHPFAHQDSFQFTGSIDDIYNPYPQQSSPSSYLQYLQQSPMSSRLQQQQYKQQHPSHTSNQPPVLQNSTAATTPLDILDPPSVKYTNFTVPSVDQSNNNSNNNDNNNKHPQAISTSSLDIDHLAMNPTCRASSVDYMNTKKPSSPCQWMMDSLYNTYLTTSDNPLNLYENNQNNETSFYLDHQSYLPQQQQQQQQQMPSSTSSHSLHQTSQNDINNMTSCLPRGYVNLSDVNSFVAESDSIKHTNSFPHLSFSSRKYEDPDGSGGAGDELQSLLGDISPATPSNNNTSFLAHSFPPVPPYPNHQSSSYSYSDSNESMDDLSDSDTTTSTQSWMVPFPQDPFSCWRDSSTSSSSSSNSTSFYPLAGGGGGMTSSISTPTIGLGHNHPRLYQHHSNSLPHHYHHHHHHHQSTTSPIYTAPHDFSTATTTTATGTATTNKRDKPTKKRGKQQENQQGNKPRRSTSSLIHPGHRGPNNNGHLQPSSTSVPSSSAAAAAMAAVAAATITNRPNGGRRKSTMSLDTTKIKLNTSSTTTKRKEVRRRESEPHSMSTVNTYVPTTSLGGGGSTNVNNSNNTTALSTATANHLHHDHFSPARLSVSESISSFLSRQRLSDGEDEEDEEDNNGDDADDDDQIHSESDHDVGSSGDEEDPSSGCSGHLVYPTHHHSYPHQKVPKNRQQYQQRRVNHNNDPNSQNNAYVRSNGGTMFHRSSSDSNDVSGPSAPSNHLVKKGRNVDKACNHCKRSHLRCDNMRPCRRCIATGKSGCKDVEHKPRGRPRLHNT